MTRRLYTWVDVDWKVREHLAREPLPDGVLSLATFSDMLVVSLASPDREKQARDTMRAWFGAAYDHVHGIFLESLDDDVRALPVLVECDPSSVRPAQRFQPKFERISFLPDVGAVFEPPPPFKAGTPQFVVFHSFKGGVGRTLHLLALLRAISEQQPKRRALVIDADLEAPGITSLLHNQSFGEPAISFVDVLALAHSADSSEQTQVISLIAERIRSQPITIPTSRGSCEHYVLATFREEGQLLRLGVRPEHLTQGRDSAWKAVDLFALVGQSLGVDIVLVDLRAGLSELASPFLFDPRAHRVLVTTPSVQSVDGTALVLRQLAKLAPPQSREDLFDPTAVISFVTPEMEQSLSLETVRVRLGKAYPDQPQRDDLTPPPRLEILETPFAQELLVIQNLGDAMTRLSATGLLKQMQEFADDWLAVPGQSTEPPKRQLTAEDRNNLGELATRLEYAEQGAGDRFLATPPLRSLAQRFGRTPPVAVVMGAKGSGKTFTYLQITRTRLWSRFVTDVLGGPDRADWGEIWPLTRPQDLSLQASEVVDECVRNAVNAVGAANPPMRPSAIDDAVRSALASDHDESWWRRYWLRLFGQSMGLDMGDGGNPAEVLADTLISRARRTVFLVDGLERLFPHVGTDARQQIALRALLQDVPSQLREMHQKAIGIVTFVRADFVRAAIPQNLGQFETLYEPFRLRWDREQALRLVVWLALEAKAPIGLPPGTSTETLRGEEAVECLRPIWGRKLGHDNSKEARTADWVIAALSDFKGQIQARDLVRLLREATQRARGTPPTDRLLTPQSIRGAVQPCSVAKIQEIEKEIPSLQPIFAALQKIEERRIPFDAVSVGLKQDQVRLLEDNGVLLSDDGEYFMPEIFRQGLGFQLASGARPRVLSLARRAMASPSRQAY